MKENNFTAVSTPQVESKQDTRFSEFSRMLHTNSVNVDNNSSDKLTVTETETEN